MKNLAGNICVVTGASGFIGRNVVDALVAQNAEVVAIVRSKHGMRQLKDGGCSVRLAGLTDADALAKAVPRADLLFHFTYDVRAGGNENLKAFETVLDWASSAGVSRIVHASSVAVYDGWPGGTIDEGAACTNRGNADYHDVKIAMEQRLSAADIPSIALQPTIVYGAGSKFWTSMPVAALRRGGVVLPEDSVRCHAVHVKDVARAAVLAAAAKIDGFERILINGGDVFSWEAFYRGYAQAIGTGDVVTRPREELFARLADRPGNAVGKISFAAQVSRFGRQAIGSDNFERLLSLKDRLSRGKTMSLPERNFLDLYCLETKISSQKAKKILGFQPREKFLATVAEIVSGYE